MATSYFGRDLDSLRDVIDFNELSALLGISAKLLGYILNKKPLKSQYTKFEIKKKNGGNRVIHAPTKNLKLLQRAISDNLSKLRNFKPCVNGFVSGRDIRRNAESHVGRRFVLNIDLEDFFGTINFGRVYGMLSSEPYSLPSSIAAAIAKASTFENKLPQGAPTSPVVSNLICTKLDAQLSRLARQFSCHYTRYADDITFSTHRKTFPLASAAIGDSSTLVLAPELVEIIHGNGFKINTSKTRLHSNSSRQEVTGLVTNERLNVRRSYIRQTRAMLHACAKYSLPLAQKTYEEKYQGSSDLLAVVQGRISFVGQIRGKSDQTYKNLAKKFNAVSPDRKISFELSPVEIAKQATWVIEGDNSYQGTAFFVGNLGIATCSHCISTNPYIYHMNRPGKKFPVTVSKNDPHRDLAILKVPDELLDVIPLQLSNDVNLTDNAELSLLGYPNHTAWKPIRHEFGRYVRSIVRHGVTTIEITPKIIEGNSGGPVLDRDCRVIGIARAGINAETAENHSEFIAIRSTELANLGP